MLETLVYFSGFLEKFPLIMMSSYFNHNFFALLFLWHTWFWIEYFYLIDDNIFYVFLFVLSSVLIDLIFFFFWKKTAQLRWKKLSSNYPVSLENYFLLYFRFIPFLWYFWSTIVWYCSHIKFKKLIRKILLWNILRFWILAIFYFISISIHKFYYEEITHLLHRAGQDIDLTPLVLYLLLYFSFVMIISIFYGIKFQKLKKQRKYW
jgi:hypothetical protein